MAYRDRKEIEDEIAPVMIGNQPFFPVSVGEKIIIELLSDIRDSLGLIIDNQNQR